MNIQEYKEQSIAAGYEEHPPFNTGLEVSLSDFVDFTQADLELKIHLNKLILCRSFYGTYAAWASDVEWFIESFFTGFYKHDFNRVELSSPIKEAVTMILSKDVHTKGVIATPFMFGVVEHCAKCSLGFKPFQFDYFDSVSKRDYIKKHEPNFNTNRDITLRKAFELLQRTDSPIARSLNEIDNYTICKLTGAGIEKGRWVEYTIARRLNLTRNPMLHGEMNGFYNAGPYLILLYTLFYLHDLQGKLL